MQRIVERLNAALSHRCAGSLLLLLLAALYAAAYFKHPLFPGTDGAALTRGWWTWADQNRYLTEAAAIAQLRLDAPSCDYPVGYPALGALFWRWMPANPFFVPDLLLVLAAAVGWWRLAVRWLTRLEAVVVAALFVATHRWLIAYTMVVPWNTIATQATLLAAIWVVTTKSGARALWWLSALAAATYLVRPIDAAAFLPLLIFATLRIETWRAKILHGIGGAVLLAGAMAATGWLNLRIFGDWRSPYEAMSTQVVGFFSYPLSYKFFWLFVDGRPLFGETEPALLFRYPWLFLALPAVVFWVQREGKTAVAGVAALTLNWLLYVNYNDLLPSDIYRFTLIHYLAWGFPLLFLLAAAAVRHGWRSRGVCAAFAAALALLVLCAGLQMDEEKFGVERAADGGWQLPDRRPLLIRFPGVPLENVTQVRLDGRPLVEYSEYLVPLAAPELRLLLGTRTEGKLLTAAPGSTLAATPPETSRYVWRWREPFSRLKGFFK